ncbi:efflux RND transporter periplasmic adaptor subunit [Kingella kingae]|uniref:efflux RND transporter periplasmic adaptor subunit n=1 Tax=Kingella kingae TaxID=504 RepID=UPI0005708FF2|nr:efflux RND transporter periplasmic adaptor subunit [Kingella kingae]
MKLHSTKRMAVIAAATLLALAACNNSAQSEAQQKAAAARAAHVPTVNVVTVQPQNVLLEYDLPGRLEAVKSATIVPQVSGIVQRRLFEEGTMVRAGQPLYQLDDATYTASLESARASLLSAQAAAAKADADLARYRPLMAADAISKQEYDAAVLAKRSAEAQIKAAQASIRAAQVNVNRARIVSPITGFIGQSLVTEGALVTANSTQMATVKQTDVLYVNIQQSSAEILQLHRQLLSQERVRNDGIQVGILLEDGSEYEHKGQLLFIDSSVDEATGQVMVRAAVPNPEQLLRSGMYVRVKLPLAGVLNAFVVPQQSVTRGEKDTVMVVTPEGKMEPRVVKVTGQKDGDWVITEGLKAGDKVIVDGTMIAAMSGAQKVQPKEWQPASKQPALSVAAPSTSVPATNVQAASESTSAVQAASTTESAASAAQ